MPDDRFFHRRLGRGERVNRLTDFERWVWMLYILAADDFGVMRFSPITLQEIAEWLEKRPKRVVERALEMVASTGLVQKFGHQGRLYCFQDNWQTYQKIEYPRPTSQPKPPDELVALCDEETRLLFSVHPGGKRAPSLKKQKRDLDLSEKLPKTFDHLAGASARMAKANGSGLGFRPSAVDSTIADRAGRFVEHYTDLYAKHRKGARYLGKPALDFQEAVALCQTWDDDRLDKIATVFLTTDHEFAEQGSRTMAQFRYLAPWCDGKLREAGL